MGRLSKWSPEFREEAIRLQRESGESITAVAKRLEVSPDLRSAGRLPRSPARADDARVGEDAELPADGVRVETQKPTELVCIEPFARRPEVVDDPGPPLIAEGAVKLGLTQLVDHPAPCLLRSRSPSWSPCLLGYRP